MFESYSSIMYKGSSDNPITCTFLEGGYKITICGEGGNRHLILENTSGEIDLWVDTHCNVDECFISSIVVRNEPGSRFINYVYRLLIDHAVSLSGGFLHLELDGIDAVFNTIYKDMLHDYISRF